MPTWQEVIRRWEYSTDLGTYVCMTPMMHGDTRRKRMAHVACKSKKLLRVNVNSRTRYSMAATTLRKTHCSNGAEHRGYPVVGGL